MCGPSMSVLLPGWQEGILNDHSFHVYCVRALSRWCTRVNGGLVVAEMHPFLLLLFCNYLLFLPAIPASGINGTSTGRRLSTANWLAGDAMGAVVEARWIQYRNVFIVFSSTTLNGFLKGLKRFYSEYSIIIQ